MLGLLLLWLRRTERPYPDMVIALLAGLAFVSVLFIYPNSDQPPPTWNTAVFAVVTFATTAVAVWSALGQRRPRPVGAPQAYGE